MRAQDQEKECCPKFDPAPWNDKILEWKKKRFVKAKVLTFFYMPLTFGLVMRRLDRKVREAGATIQQGMGLSDHTSRWNMDLYLAVDREVPGTQNTTLSGTFLSKVYEGDFRETGDWCRDFERYAGDMNMDIRKWYMWYTTCPKCARKYGKNFVAILGQLN